MPGLVGSGTLYIKLYYKRSYMFPCLCSIFREIW